MIVLIRSLYVFYPKGGIFIYDLRPNFHCIKYYKELVTYVYKFFSHYSYFQFSTTNKKKSMTKSFYSYNDLYYQN